VTTDSPVTTNRTALRWDPRAGTGLPPLPSAVIDGEWVHDDGPRLQVEDPATGAVIAEVVEATDAVIDRAVESAHRAFTTVWGPMSGPERGRILARIAAELRNRAGELATLEAVDTGKPLSQATVDVEVAARYFEYYAGLADKIHGETIPQPGGTFAYTLREPLGVVAHITPWNSPLNQLSRGVAPSLAAGNTVVIKPSEVAPLSSLVAAMLFVAAGLPPGACNVIPGMGPTVGTPLARHPLVKHVSFTGSVATGRTILHLAADKIMPCMLELGGKSPTIIMPDADLEAAAKAGALAVVRNSGQSCFATTRLLVHRSVHDELVDRLVGNVSGLRMGHALDDLDLGPLASARQLTRVSDYLDTARGEGASIAVGGSPADVGGAGYYFTPTVLVDVTNDMRVAREEIFGPVQSVLTFDDEEEAVAIANDTTYGLAAGVFTRDLSTAHRLARRLQAGQIQVNRYPLGGVETPFGGYKSSGLGREKGLEALRHYTQLKTVLMAVE
jgi:aldehyde dehydrogenase (NAD+)